jgi:glyoxylase-like metal-dependent hydrolase (beta-lactamase superfamily II)
MIKGIFRVAGADITDQRDCNVYLVDFGGEAVLVDAGFGAAFDRMLANIEDAGVPLSAVSSVVLTHCHLDHIGAASRLRERLGCRLVMHELDAEIVERGDNRLTAAFCFDVIFQPLPIDVRLKGTEGKLAVGGDDISFIHIPGHTPGSVALYIDNGGKRVLFGQDIGAPLLDDFDCDKAAWHRSMEKLLALRADVLCDGHSGVYQPARSVAAYIRHFLHAYGDEGKTKG